MINARSGIRTALKFSATAVAVYITIILGSGVAGLILDLGLGFNLHISDDVRRVFIDSAALGGLMGSPGALALTIAHTVRTRGGSRGQ